MCRAKVMVDVNNCPANVFCIGQLKAKDLKGNELSDVTYRRQQEENESECSSVADVLLDWNGFVDDDSSTMDEDSNDVQPDQDEDDEEEEAEEDEEEE